MTRVRIRGIYATALTAALEETVSVVQATPPIERRFETSFPLVPADAAIEMTGDRQGVGITGTPSAVETVRARLTDLGRDALAWTDPTPRGAVLRATVTHTLGSGAVVAFEGVDREGFLPYDAVEDRVTDGDRLRVQVHEPAPPWLDRRPVVRPTVRVFGHVAGLERDGTRPKADVPDRERANELAQLPAMLPTDVPEGWAVRWGPGAADADTETLDAALGGAVERAMELETALDASGAPIEPAATHWVWFGRETRFALDERRGRATGTLSGHHRIKAIGETAATAVDFAEGIAASVDRFPFEAVADAFGPRVEDRLRIDHGKPDGRRFTLGEGSVVERSGRTVTLRREMTSAGTYDALGTPREPGDVAITKLKEGRWWYPTVYRGEDDVAKGTYVNVCTPVELLPDAATYVDLHVDVIRRPDGSVERVDDDELDAAVDAGEVPEALAGKAREVAGAVADALGD